MLPAILIGAQIVKTLGDFMVSAFGPNGFIEPNLISHIISAIEKELHLKKLKHYDNVPHDDKKEEHEFEPEQQLQQLLNTHLGHHEDEQQLKKITAQIVTALQTLQSHEKLSAPENQAKLDLLNEYLRYFDELLALEFSDEEAMMKKMNAINNQTLTHSIPLSHPDTDLYDESIKIESIVNSDNENQPQIEIQLNPDVLSRPPSPVFIEDQPDNSPNALQDANQELLDNSQVITPIDSPIRKVRSPSTSPVRIPSPLSSPILNVRDSVVLLDEKEISHHDNKADHDSFVEISLNDHKDSFVGNVNPEDHSMARLDNVHSPVVVKADPKQSRFNKWMNCFPSICGNNRKAALREDNLDYNPSGPGLK